MFLGFSTREMANKMEIGTPYYRKIENGKLKNKSAVDRLRRFLLSFKKDKKDQITVNRIENFENKINDYLE